MPVPSHAWRVRGSSRWSRRTHTGWEPLAPWGYGVATIEEGAELRAAGITRPVLVFMPARPDLFDAYRAHRLTPALGDRASISAWIARGAGGAGGAGGGAFHLEIDTGMSRSGV